ncbi:MAG: PepSY domain-containing protein [Streptosporangiales bacterium]|nr:PepSY domain-containing protein [Streptosporangiales bacterium]
MRDTPSAAAAFRPLLMRLHFYAGIFVGPFVLVAAISGMLYALTPQLEQVVYDDQLHTESRGTPLPLAQQLVSARAVEPTAQLTAIRPAAAAGETTRVLFGGRSPFGDHRTVFVDPVTGEVRGQLTTYGSSGALPVRAVVDKLHRELWLGEPGRVYSELAASWLWVLTLGGLALWWTARRGRRRTAASPRRRARSWHVTVGLCAALGMLMLSATGLTWSRFAGEHVTTVREAFDWATPSVAATGGHPSHGMTTSDRAGVGPDQAARAAAAAGMSAPYEVRPPSHTDGYVVQQVQTSWPARADAMEVDPRTGAVTERIAFDDWPLAAKLARWGIQLHMGLLFGGWNQAGLVLLALAIVGMVCLGYRMWWLRRPTRGHHLKLARPPGRVRWQQLPRLPLALLLAVACGVGWFLPLLGLSLLAFLLVDVALGLRTPAARPRTGERQLSRSGR